MNARHLPLYAHGHGRLASRREIEWALRAAGLELDGERRAIARRLRELSAPPFTWAELHQSHHLALPGCPLCEERQRRVR